MMEFEEIKAALVDDAFNDLTKIVQAMTDDEREAYAERNPVRIWLVAGIDENNAFAISAN